MLLLKKYCLYLVETLTCTIPATSKRLPVDLFWKPWYDLSMPSLTPKQIGGHTYYYARYCQRVDGKPKIVRQVYLGKIDDLVAAAERSQRAPQSLETEVAAFADIAALFDIAQGLDLVQLLDSILPAKRHQGLSVGQYLLLAAINRAVSPTSKLQFADWYRQTALPACCLPIRLHYPRRTSGTTWIWSPPNTSSNAKSKSPSASFSGFNWISAPWSTTALISSPISTLAPPPNSRSAGIISRSAAICVKSASACWSAPIFTSLCSTRFTLAISTTGRRSNPSPRNSPPITGSWPNPAITSPWSLTRATIARRHSSLCNTRPFISWALWFPRSIPSC